MKNKNNLFMLEKFKGFVFGFVFAAALVAVGVYAANTDAVQKKWKAVWHGTDWIDAGRVVRSEELAENLEWLKKRIDDLEVQINNSTTINYTNLPPGVVVAGCFIKEQRLPGIRVDEPRIVKCYGGANGSLRGRTWVHGNCPAGTDKFDITNAIESYEEVGGMGDSGQWGVVNRVVTIGFLCIKK